MVLQMLLWTYESTTFAILCYFTHRNNNYHNNGNNEISNRQEFPFHTFKNKNDP